MSNRKDESSGHQPTERPPQGTEPFQSGQRAAKQATEIAEENQRAMRQAADTAQENVQRTAKQAVDISEENAEAVQKNAEKAVEFGRRTSDLTAQMADRGLRQAADMARKQTEQARNLMSASTNAYREVAEYSQVDIDAMLRSSSRLAQGLQEVSWEVTQFTQHSVRLGMRLANELLECRTVEEMVNAQRDFLKESVDVFIAESARILSLSSRMTNDAVNPLAERVNNAESQQQPQEQPFNRPSSPPKESRPYRQ